jgi:hypothetical protein
LLSNQDIEVVYSSVDRLEMKGHELNPDEIIEANEVQDIGGTQEPQLIRIQ